MLWSARVSNDQDALTELLDRVDAGDEVGWAVDLIECETALLRAVLTAAGHQVIYVPGRTVKTMTGAFAMVVTPLVGSRNMSRGRADQALVDAAAAR